MSLATWVRDCRKLSASRTCRLTTGGGAEVPPLVGRGLPPVQHPLAALQDGRVLVGPEPRGRAGMKPRRPQEGRRIDDAERPGAGHAAGMADGRRDGGRSRAEEAAEQAAAPEGAGERGRQRREQELPRRELGEVDEDRADEALHVELAGPDEVADRLLGAAERPDQRLADALAEVLHVLVGAAERIADRVDAGELRLLDRPQVLGRRAAGSPPPPPPLPPAVARSPSSARRGGPRAGVGLGPGADVAEDVAERIAADDPADRAGIVPPAAGEVLGMTDSRSGRSARRRGSPGSAPSPDASSPAASRGCR